MLRKEMKFLLTAVVAVIFFVLLWSVIISGFNYRLDADELFNANSIYLMIKGLAPYKDFYTVYSPILHWILTPVFLISGFNFAAVAQARLVMIGFFLIRILFMFLLADRLFNRRIAVLAVVLYLLNPFTVFADMQIRPDNLMILFYLLLLLVFTTAWEKKSGILFFLSGILFGVTVLTNVKILPSLAALFVVFGYIAYKKKFLKHFLLLTDGILAAVLVFFGYFFIRGEAAEMFLHVFLDGIFRLNQSIPSPTWLGYFYFSNPVIYGFEGKPFNWMFAWILPLAAFAGAYIVFQKSLRDERLGVVKQLLCLSLVAQWVSMLFINSVFIQYYIPLNWLYGLFAAVLVNDLSDHHILRAGVVLFLIAVTVTSVFANIERSKWNSDQLKAEYESLWARIPADQPVFPNLLFRPTIYPILSGATFATFMRDRFAPAYFSIEKNKLPYLIGMTDEYFSYLDADSQEYIKKNFRPDSNDARFWRRKSAP